MYTDHKMLLVANEMFYLLPLKANSHCIHRCWQMATDAFVRFCLISVLRLSASAAVGQHLFSTTEHAESVFVRSRMSEKGHIGLRLSAQSELTWIFTAAAWFTLPCCLFEVYKNQSDPKWSVIAFIFYKHFVMMLESTLMLSQDGAEDGSRVASSGKTLQFFVCFICLFVVLRVRCC